MFDVDDDCDSGMLEAGCWMLDAGCLRLNAGRDSIAKRMKVKGGGGGDEDRTVLWCTTR